MVATPPRHIASLDDLHRRLPEMVKQQETHPRLAIAALANPLLALERLGYTIASEIAREVAIRTRFRGEDAERLLTLDQALRTDLGDDADLDDAPTLAPRLLKLMGETARKKSVAAPLREALHKPVIAAPIGRPPLADPLADFRAAHPVIDRLVTYRALDASRPRLASPALFEAILAGKAASPVTAARLRYKRAPERKAGAR